MFSGGNLLAHIILANNDPNGACVSDDDIINRLEHLGLKIYRTCTSDRYIVEIPKLQPNE